MGLKSKLIQKKRNYGIKRNIYNMYCEEKNYRGLAQKMRLCRKVFAEFQNSFGS